MRSSFDKAGKIRGMFDATSTSECERMRTKLLQVLEEEPPQRAWRPRKR